jgi:hypothetical protein
VQCERNERFCGAMHWLKLEKFCRVGAVLSSLAGRFNLLEFAKRHYYRVQHGICFPKLAILDWSRGIGMPRCRK